MAIATKNVIDSLLDVWGKSRTTFVDYTITGSYTGGGYVIKAADVGLKFFRSVDIAGGDVSMGTYFPVFDFGTASPGSLYNSVAMRFFTASGVEATGAISPTINIRVQFIGQ